MSLYKVNVVARNPKREELETAPLEALVHTGSELTWLPAELLKAAGITPRPKRVFSTTTQRAEGCMQVDPARSVIYNFV